jgi:hypothetical protein
MDEFTFTLSSPITEEDWDMITDVDFDHTNEITFHTRHGKEVKFIKQPTSPCALCIYSPPRPCTVCEDCPAKGRET